MSQAPATAEGSTQVARPDTSEVSTLHAAGFPPVILMVPATSSFAPGVVVQIPMFHAGDPTVPVKPVPKIIFEILS